MIDPRELHQANRVAWNQAAERYAREVERDIAFLRGGGTNFVGPEYAYLQDLGSWCRRALHLQCAGGLDTLSLLNMGATEVIGVDISEVMITCARAKSDALDVTARWYCCDVLDTPRELDGTADLLYTGRGALLWVMDIAAWAATVARLLVPGGRLYLFEGHPITWILDAEADEFRLDPVYSDYFSETVCEEQGWSPQYIGSLSVGAAQLARKYERQWTLGQVMNALLAAGLQLERFEEHPEQYWDQFPNLPEEARRCFPNTYSLLMGRPQ
jgi:SAM-dependent methyltransferase